MIKLKSLKLKAFRSFVEESKIDFPSDGLILIRGINPTTGDSSGAGKSSVMLAISYALDMCPYSAIELQSWYTEEPMQVQLCLETPKGEVTINKGKRNSLKIGTQPNITGAKAIAEGIKSIFNLDSDTLKAITYRPQGTGGLFLSLSDSEKKEFLTRILGLIKIEEAVDKAESKIKELKPLMEAEELKVSNFNKELEGLLAQNIPELTNDAPQKAELITINKEIIEIQDNIQMAWDVAKEAKAKAEDDPRLISLKQTLQTAQMHYQNVSKANLERLNAFRQKHENLRKQLQSAAAQDNMKLNIVRDIGRYKEDLQKALSGSCPTCFRTWDGADRKAEEIQSLIKNLEAQLESFRSSDNRKQLEDQLREVFQEDPTLEKFKFVCSQLQDQIKERTVELNTGPVQEAQGKVNYLNTQKAGFQARRTGLEQQIQMICDMNKKLEVTKRLLESNVLKLKKELEVSKIKLNELQTVFNAERDFALMMGKSGFLGIIFQEALTDIENRTNERLANLANVSNVTIHFKSETETAKGVIKQKITPIGYINGHEARLESGLSGGMMSSVEGVVDLAVMAVAQERTGTLPGWLLLDESFNGLGTASKESAMEILREYANEKLVMIIDHSSETKQSFSQFISVVYNNGISEIKNEETHA